MTLEIRCVFTDDHSAVAAALNPQPANRDRFPAGQHARSHHALHPAGHRRATNLNPMRPRTIRSTRTFTMTPESTNGFRAIVRRACRASRSARPQAPTTPLRYWQPCAHRCRRVLPRATAAAPRASDRLRGPARVAPRGADLSDPGHHADHHRDSPRGACGHESPFVPPWDPLHVPHASVLGPVGKVAVGSPGLNRRVRSPPRPPPGFLIVTARTNAPQPWRGTQVPRGGDCSGDLRRHHRRGMVAPEQPLPIPGPGHRLHDPRAVATAVLVAITARGAARRAAITTELVEVLYNPLGVGGPSHGIVKPSNWQPIPPDARSPHTIYPSTIRLNFTAVASMKQLALTTRLAAKASKDTKGPAPDEDLTTWAPARGLLVDQNYSRRTDRRLFS